MWMVATKGPKVNIFSRAWYPRYEIYSVQVLWMIPELSALRSFVTAV